MKTLHKFNRKSSKGSNLAILVAVGIMLIGFLGISLYSGAQSFIQDELQRATTSAAMAGASAYYGAVGPGGVPAPNPSLAKNTATSAFNAAVANGSLGGFSPKIVNVSNDDSNDSITIDTKATLPTPFLTPIGIKSIDAAGKATARALKYEPTQFTGPLAITPNAAQIGSYQGVIDLAFPLVDGPGNDLYLEQDATLPRQPYVVEACNNVQCYNITSAATPVGTSKVTTNAFGTLVIYGTAIIDLQKAGVHKANKIRITHSNVFEAEDATGVIAPLAAATPLTIQRVMLFGYAGLCSAPQSCGIPAGFEPVE